VSDYFCANGRSCWGRVPASMATRAGGASVNHFSSLLGSERRLRATRRPAPVVASDHSKSARVARRARPPCPLWRRSAAAIYSLLGSAKPNGLDPQNLSPPRPRTHRRTSHQQDQRAVAMEPIAPRKIGSLLNMYPHGAMWIHDSDTHPEVRSRPPRPHAYQSRAL
jgi:hypothetical protein